MKYLICLIAVIFALAIPVYAVPSVIDFEDLYTGVELSDILPDGYAGFNWSSSAHWTTSAYPLSIPGYTGTDENGYKYGTIGNVSLITDFAQSISMSGPAFNFLGAYITSAWNIGQNFTVEGWRSGSKVYSNTHTTSYDEPHWFDFSFYDIDELRIIPGQDGVDAIAGDGGGQHLIIDNITITPEPCTLILLGLGSMVLRRRKKASPAA